MRNPKSYPALGALERHFDTLAQEYAETSELAAVIATSTDVARLHERLSLKCESLKRLAAQTPVLVDVAHEDAVRAWRADIAGEKI